MSEQFKFTCICGYQWNPKQKDSTIIPKSCPLCHRYRWQASPKGWNTGAKNGQWKGDNVGYTAIHDYIKYHLPRPEKCQNCGESKNLDLANISQEYKRDFSDWEWLCRKCHMHKDGRAVRLRFNWPHTAESLAKMSAAHKGKQKSKEWIDKIVASGKRTRLNKKLGLIPSPAITVTVETPQPPAK